MDDSPEREINENEDEEFNQLVEITQAAIAYQAIYSHKKPCRTSSYTGSAWLEELMDEDANPIRYYQMFRMDKIVFNNLMHDLVTRYGLEGTRNVDVREMLGIFLHILGHGIGNRLTQERFQRSGETISRYFGLVLGKICEMGKDLIQPADWQFRDVPEKIKNNRRFYPYFKVCFDY